MFMRVYRSCGTWISSCLSLPRQKYLWMKFKIYFYETLERGKRDRQQSSSNPLRVGGCVILFVTAASMTVSSSPSTSTVSTRNVKRWIDRLKVIIDKLSIILEDGTEYNYYNWTCCMYFDDADLKASLFIEL